MEASSGSAAISEAYFARLLDLPFIAVMPRSTSQQKIAAIKRLGGTCHLIDNPAGVYDVAAGLAREAGGHCLDQFTYAERATDWRGNNNVAESIFEQMRNEPHAEPAWVVMGAGTGGTSATIGRYIRYRNFNTRLCVVDVEYSAFCSAYCNGDPGIVCDPLSRIEGVGCATSAPASKLASLASNALTAWHAAPGEASTTQDLRLVLGRGLQPRSVHASQAT